MIDCNLPLESLRTRFLNMYKIAVYILVLMLCPFFGACTPVATQNEFDQANQDYKNLYTADVSERLTLDDAVNLAINNNLDAQIAEQDFIVSLSDIDLQKLNALPTITAKRDFLKRNNFAASSSISAETGVQSLEPSISSDRSSRVTALELNWQLVDVAINIYRSSSAEDQSKIAQERYRKVLQNIILDTHSAYYRLALFQKYEQETLELLEQSEQKLAELNTAKSNGDIGFDNIDKLKKNIFEIRAGLLENEKLQRLAEIELKALLSVNPTQPIRVAYEELDLDPEERFSKRKDIDSYVNRALKSRPEVKEEFLNLRVAQRSANIEVLNTIPGFSIFAAANNDDNSFLEERDWFSLTATISQSITRLLTLPTRHKKAEEEIALANARREALVAAVIFQVNIAYMGFSDTYNEFLEARRIFDVNESAKKRKDIMEENGLISGLETFVNSAQYQIDRIKLTQKLVDFLLSQQRLNHSVGDFSFYDVPDIKVKVEKPAPQAPEGKPLIYE